MNGIPSHLTDREGLTRFLKKAPYSCGQRQGGALNQLGTNSQAMQNYWEGNVKGTYHTDQPTTWYDNRIDKLTKDQVR